MATTGSIALRFRRGMSGSVWMAEMLQLLPGGELLNSGTRVDSGAFLLGLCQSPDAPRSWWKEVADAWLARLCQLLPESETQVAVPPLPEAEMSRFLDSAPPLPGMEYLSPEILQRFWDGLNFAATAEVQKVDGGLEAWLQRIHPQWKLVGRVSFHLAENPRSLEFPFAFLATWTQRLSADAVPQYVPLGRALKDFTKREDTQVLQSFLAPVQKAAKQCALVREMLDSGDVFRALPWTPADAWRFLQSVSELEGSGVLVRMPDWWKHGKPPRPQVQVEVDPPEDQKAGLGSMLRFNVNVALGGERLSREELEELLEAAAGLVSIRGKWVEVDREKLQDALRLWRKAARAAASGGVGFLDGIRMVSGMRKASVSGLPDLTAALEQGSEWTSFAAGPGLSRLLSRMRNPENLPDIDCGGSLHAELRPYQQRGVNWLWMLTQAGFGACLADDMGLGKTLQVIATLLHGKQEDEQLENPPTLLVVPASLMANWKAEIEKFAPSLAVFFAHPSQTPRERLKSISFDAFDVVITTYGMLGRLEAIADFRWNLVVLDEAQAIRNAGTDQAKAVKLLKARARIAMTGTPVENKLTDLWSLIDFLNPGLLGTEKQFKESVKSLETTGFGPLRQLVNPYVLRRLKSDPNVIDDLPDKTEVRTNCPLTKAQAALYQQTVSQLAKDLQNPEMPEIQRKGLILSNLMQLKQICNHTAMWTGSGNYDPAGSGKFARLRAICEEVLSRGEKLLVFTQFSEMTGPLSEFLGHLSGRNGLVLTGKTSVIQRQKLVEEFQSVDGPPCFILSLRAGGTGLNLTAASHVIHFDRWWNPAVEDQATDRAYRIGQKRNVLVHKFVCPGTIEDRIDEMIAKKRALAGEIVQDGMEQMLTEMSDDELLDLVSMDLNRAVF